MRRVAWGAALLWAVSSAAFSAVPDPALTSLDFSVNARVEVDASGNGHVVEMGKVTKLSNVPSLEPIAQQIAQRLRERIETWQFTPASKDGQTVPSATNVYVGLTGFDDGHGGLEVRIRYAETGGELRDVNMTALIMTASTAGAEGFVTVDVEYDARGKVVSASVHESGSFEHGRFVNTADKDLRKGVLKAAQRWVFLPEQVAGTPIGGSGRVPVVLCTSDACSSAKIDNGPGGDEAHFAAVDPAVKLRSAVAGTAL